jgi:AcrR family transcriptional regulator
MKKVLRTDRLSRRPPLTRERILNTALTLADKGGLESVTMRQVANDLGVKAMSLYKHVSHKSDLLDGIAELVATQMNLPSPELGWKQALRERAHSERKILSGHTWAVNLFESRTGRGATRLRHQNHMIGILRQAGFSLELAFNALITQTSYVYGFVVLELAWSTQSQDRSKNFEKPEVVVSEEEHPYVFEMINFVIEKRKRNISNETHSTNRHSADFDFGLNLIIDGLEKKRI